MKTKRVIVLGAGLIGRPIALDLIKESDFEVSIVDIDESKLASFKGSKVKALKFDISNEDELTNLISKYDYAINAVPGFIGYSTLKAAINSKRNIIDIAFFPEDANTLNDLAIQNDVTVITDMGVAPGLSHLLVGYAASRLDTIDKAIIYVGGLPKIRKKPYEYKAVFSPIDVIEEYTRPARLVENGKIIIKKALTDIELLEFGHIGTLEAFNSDGLRSLVKSIQANYMAEKTLRYPGHANLMKIFRDSGFFNTKKIQIGDSSISPIELTSKLLFKQWKLEENEEDLTIMKIIIEGKKENKSKKFVFDLYDEYDNSTKIHSMARTTGYTATSALRMLDENLFTKKGVFYPEEIGKKKECVDFILQKLKDRGIIVNSSVS